MKNHASSRYLIFCLLSAIVLSGCSLGQHKIKVAFMLPNFTNYRYLKEKEYFAAGAQSKGVEVEIADGNNDDNLQIGQANDFIERGVDVIVITCVNKNTAAQIVRHAHKHGVKVIAYDRIIKYCPLDYFFSFDNEKVGELMATYALNRKPEGTYMLLGGDKGDQNAIWVKDGQMKVLSPAIKSGKIKLVYDVFVEDWGSDNACYELKHFYNLSGAFPNVVLAASDGVSVGVSRALVQEGVSQFDFPLVTGQNANLEACKNITKGTQTMTVYKPIKQFAEEGLDLAIRCAKGESIECKQTIDNGFSQIPSILHSVVSVDINNLKSTVIADGFLKQSDVYGEK